MILQIPSIETPAGESEIRTDRGHGDIGQFHNVRVATSVGAALLTRRVRAKAAAVVGLKSQATGKTCPRLQIITLAELFQGKKPGIPFVDQASVKRAKREDTGRQERLI